LKANWYPLAENARARRSRRRGGTGQ